MLRYVSVYLPRSGTVYRGEHWAGEQSGWARSSSSETETVGSRGRSSVEYSRPSQPPDPGGEGCKQPLSTVSWLAGLHLGTVTKHLDISCGLLTTSLTVSNNFTLSWQLCRCQRQHINLCRLFIVASTSLLSQVYQERIRSTGCFPLVDVRISFIAITLLVGRCASCIIIINYKPASVVISQSTAKTKV